MKKLVLVLTLLGVIGCAPRKEVVDVINGKDGNNGRDGANGHSIVSAYSESSELECANGGTRLDLFVDMDDSLSASEGDVYQSSLVACNGLNGLNGIDGLDGTDGKDGIDGQDGADGRDGRDGEDGERGERGEQGRQGVAGATGPQGAIGPQGPAGATGSQGPVGPQGPQGPQGLQGPAGSSGATIIASSSTCTQLDGNYYTKNNTLYLEDDSNLCDGNNDKVSLNSSGDSMWIATRKLVIKDGAGNLRMINFN
jgi:hypothetical protein